MSERGLGVVSAAETQDLGCGTVERGLITPDRRAVQARAAGRRARSERLHAAEVEEGDRGRLGWNR